MRQLLVYCQNAIMTSPFSVIRIEGYIQLTEELLYTTQLSPPKTPFYFIILAYIQQQDPYYQQKVTNISPFAKVIIYGISEQQLVLLIIISVPQSVFKEVQVVILFSQMRHAFKCKKQVKKVNKLELEMYKNENNQRQENKEKYFQKNKNIQKEENNKSIKIKIQKIIKNYQQPVSYTHLTLPTICSVQISVVAVSLKKKKKK
eukprot:TRINITY_DN5432_c0_g1_i5.p2 TRINITY_DN5432_c0_g1~~TRINITY_DN5432_c0_g1_i5.p2  ORF type:complete len:203 (-),score=47.21 TRINITY_DN5432_c0_g1_i5:99-707(-)